MKASEHIFADAKTIKRTEKILIPQPNNKWDRYLDDYNNYLKEYKKHFKNSQNGDVISLSLYPYMKEKLEVLKERIAKAGEEKRLTEKQIKRVSKINIKIVQ